MKSIYHLLAPLVLLVPFTFFAESPSQAAYLVRFPLSLLALWLLGDIILKAIEKPNEGGWNEFFFTKIFLGQWLALILFLCCSPFFALFSHLSGIHVAIRVVVYFILFLTLFWQVKRQNYLRQLLSNNTLHLGHYLLTLYGVAVMARIVSWHGASISAVGLDTHQHMYWTNDIMRQGYLPWRAQGTSIMESYTKGLHVITGIWAGFGLETVAGSYLKLMPFIQSFLPIAMIAEATLSEEKKLNRLSGYLILGLTILAIKLCVFDMLRIYYPYIDLNSTGREISTMSILSPLVLLWLSLRMQWKSLATLILMASPFIFMISAIINPSLVVIFISFTSVVSCFIFAAYRPKGLLTLSFPTKKVFGFFCGLAILVCILDPFLHQRIIGFMPEGYLKIINSMDIYTPSQAESLGLKSVYQPIALAAASGEPTACHNLGCFVSRAGNFFNYDSETLKGIFLDAISLDQVAFRAPNSIFNFYSMFFLLLIPQATVIFIRKKKANPQLKTNLMFLAGIFTGLLLSVVVGFMIREMVRGGSFEILLLSDYVIKYEQIIGPCLGAVTILILLDSVLALAVSYLNQPAPRFFGTKTTILALSGSLSLVLSLGYWGTGHAYFDINRGWYGPLSKQQLKQFNEMERSLGDSKGILVDVRKWPLGGQMWLIPDESIARYLPFGEKNYVFNITLGHGYKFSWNDFEDNFCTSNPQKAREFLAKNNIGWILVGGPFAAKQGFYDNKGICTVALKHLGAVFPSEHTGEDFTFYQVSPDYR